MGSFDLWLLEIGFDILLLQNLAKDYMILKLFKLTA